MRKNSLIRMLKGKEQVRQQNEFLNNVLESLTHPLIVVDANDYTVKMANSAAQQLYGSKFSDKVTCYMLSHMRDKPCDTNEHLCPIEEIKRTGRPVIVEHIHYDKDGKPKNVEVHAYPILDDGGNVSEIIEYTFDITERKKAEEEIKQSAEEWQMTFDSITNLVSIHDKNYKIIKVNKTFANVFKMKPEEIIGKTCYELIHGTGEPWPDCPSRELLKTGKSAEVEFFEPRLGIHLRVSSSPIFSKEGEPVGFIHITQDITERRKMEEELKAERNKLQATMAAMEGGVTIQDREYKIIYQNRFLEEMFGGLGEKCYRVYEGKEETCEGCPVEKAFRDGKFHTAERKVVMPNGEIRYWDNVASPIRDATGEIVSCVELSKDITERKKAEEEIKKQNELVETVINSLQYPFYVIGTDYTIILSNKAAKERGVVEGGRCYQLTHRCQEPCSSEHICPLKEVIRTGKPAVTEHIHFDNDVNGRNFEVHGDPIFDKDGQVIQMIEYSIDITERKKAEAELKIVQEKLIETARTAGMAEVAADVLHNVRNVLNSINVSTTVIREKVTNSELANLEKVASIINEHTDDLGTFLTEHPQGKHIPVYLTEVSKCLQNEQTDIIDKLKVLTDNVQHIKDIVGMQQDYTKVSGVEVQTSLSKLAEDAIQINSAGLERHGTQLIREFEELGDVEIDKQKLLQILVNLVSNAKYALSGCDKEEKLLTIRIYKHSEERFRIEVADNGVGISEDSLTKIFSHGFTTKKHGHGFGLHSSALAAEEIGGSLTVHSDGVGKGATFTLELPFKPVEVMK